MNELIAALNAAIAETQNMAAMDQARALLVSARDEAVLLNAPPGGEAWTRIDSDQVTPSGAYFRHVVPIGNGDIWCPWGDNWLFSLATSRFYKTNAVNGPLYDIAQRENYGASFDPDRNKVWLGYSSYPYIPEHNGDIAYDVAAQTYGDLFPVVTSSSDPNYPMRAIGSTSCAFEYYGNRLYRWGRWATSAAGQAMQSRDLPAGVPISMVCVPTPKWGQNLEWGAAQADAPREVGRRSGMHAEGIAWSFADDNEYWTRDISAGVAPFPPWVKNDTTGDAPDVLALVFAFDAPRNRYVAYCGAAGVSGTMGATVQKTWFLDRATKVWSKGPGHGVGETLPPPRNMAGENLVYNPVAQCVMLVVDFSSGQPTQVWKLT